MGEVIDLRNPRLLYRNPLDLPRIAFAEIVANTAEGVYVEPPGAARHFHRAAPAFHDDPDGAGVFSPFRDETVASPPVFTLSLRDVVLRGFRSVCGGEGFFTNDLGHLSGDGVAAHAAAMRDFDELSGLAPKTDGFAPAAAGREVIDLAGPVVLLTSGEAGNYGSFLYRELPKLVGHASLPEHWRFLAYLGNPVFERLLELAGLPMARVIRHDPLAVYRVEQAIIPGLRNPYALADAATLELYAGLRAACAAGVAGRRLYVARHTVSAENPAGRVMLNEPELIERLRPLGFEICEPQHLTAVEQIATFAAAELVVGPSGAGMFNAVFCRPGTRLIDIESEPHWIVPHCNLFASLGLRYGIFEGRAENRDWTVHHKPWRVNIEALLRRIEAF